MRRICFDDISKSDKLASWLECLEHKLFIPRALSEDSSCLWVQRRDDETKRVVEDLLAEEMHLMRTEGHGVLLEECLVDQLVSLFGVELPSSQMPWKHLLALYSFAYRRQFPLELFVRNYFSHASTTEEGLSGEVRALDGSGPTSNKVAQVLAGIRNRRLTPSWRKQHSELWVHINSQFSLPSSSSPTKGVCVETQWTSDLREKLERPFPSPAGIGVVSSDLEDDRPDEDIAQQASHPPGVSSVFSFCEPTREEQFMACRLFRCFSGGLLMRSSELPTTYTRLFQCALDFKAHVKDGYACKKFMDWIRSLPYFSMPNYRSEGRVYWIRRLDKGAALWIAHFQCLYRDTLCHVRKLERNKAHIYLGALLKKQARGLFGTVVRMRISSLHAMLLDVYGASFQVPLPDAPFDTSSSQETPLADRVALIRTWHLGPVRHLSMGTEEFVHVEPLPGTERAMCACSSCHARDGPFQSTHVPLERRLGIDEQSGHAKMTDEEEPVEGEAAPWKALLNPSKDLFEPLLPARLAQIPRLSLDAFFHDHLYGQRLNSEGETHLAMAEEHSDGASAPLSLLFHTRLTAETLPYYRVQAMPADHYGNFQSYLVE
jgi:hypothetical protein